MGQFSNSFPKHFSYLWEYAFRFDLSCSSCEYPFIFHCLHCSPSCFDPYSNLLAYLWLGLSWIDCISAKKSFSSPKTSSRKPYTSSKQQERQKHSVETTINFSGGGVVPDAGSGPFLREFPHGGADACTPRQGVTLLYGPSICTRSVQMDLRRNQARRPFPTPGSGTLWVSGESLWDRRVSCLARWICALPAAPHRTPKAVRAVGTALGQAHWPPPQAGATSGRWPAVPGVTNLIACAQVGPIRTPGGAPNP